MRQKFYESLAAQSDLMDKVSAQLLTLELAIPGLYAAVLKLVSGDKATVALSPFFYLTFACWLLVLALTLVAIIPKKWKVNPELLRQTPQKMAAELGIEDFFEKSAERKRGLIIASSLLFFAGIVSAAYTIG
jgi:cytochrome c biogenesis factor